MQVLITISDEDYEDIKQGYADNYQRNNAINCIKNGIVVRNSKLYKVLNGMSFMQRKNKKSKVTP